jgi:hypothetical protein
MPVVIIALLPPLIQPWKQSNWAHTIIAVSRKTLCCSGEGAERETLFSENRTLEELSSKAVLGNYLPAAHFARYMS